MQGDGTITGKQLTLGESGIVKVRASQAATDVFRSSQADGFYTITPRITTNLSVTFASSRATSGTLTPFATSSNSPAPIVYQLSDNAISAGVSIVDGNKLQAPATRPYEQGDLVVTLVARQAAFAQGTQSWSSAESVPATITIRADTKLPAGLVFPAQTLAPGATIQLQATSKSPAPITYVLRTTGSNAELYTIGNVQMFKMTTDVVSVTIEARQEETNDYAAGSVWTAFKLGASSPSQPQLTLAPITPMAGETVPITVSSNSPGKTTIRVDPGHQDATLMRDASGQITAVHLPFGAGGRMMQVIINQEAFQDGQVSFGAAEEITKTYTIGFAQD
jgi:hypothetical protein